MLREFKVSMASRFWLEDGPRAKRGDWQPTFFTYHEVPRDGRIHQWLVVADRPNVRITLDGKEYALTLSPVRCRVNSMENLEGPCVAKTLHKVLSHQ